MANFDRPMVRPGSCEGLPGSSAPARRRRHCGLLGRSSNGGRCGKPVGAQPARRRASPCQFVAPGPVPRGAPGLYSLDSQLSRAEARAAVLQAQAARIERDRAAVRHRLGVASHDLRISQRQLALRLHTLYEQEGNDPLAIILGAQSLDEAITSLDDLSRAAQQNKQVAAQSRDAKSSLSALAGSWRTRTPRSARWPLRGTERGVPLRGDHGAQGIRLDARVEAAPERRADLAARRPGAGSVKRTRR